MCLVQNNIFNPEFILSNCYPPEHVDHGSETHVQVNENCIYLTWHLKGSRWFLVSYELLLCSIQLGKIS